MLGQALGIRHSVADSAENASLAPVSIFNGKGLCQTLNVERVSVLDIRTPGAIVYRSLPIVKQCHSAHGIFDVELRVVFSTHVQSSTAQSPVPGPQSSRPRNPVSSPDWLEDWTLRGSVNENSTEPIVIGSQRTHKKTGRQLTGVK